MRSFFIAVAGLALFASSVTNVRAAPLPIVDGDMEAADRAQWQTYGTPLVIEKDGRARSGKQSLHVVTDNQDVMGGGLEGVSRSLGKLDTGDRLRVSFWLRPLAGRAITVGIGRHRFEQVWEFMNTDWMEVVCDFRVRGPGDHTIYITQSQSANAWLMDDFRVQTIPRLQLGTAPAAERVAIQNAAARLWFDRKTGALCGIENLATKEVLSPLDQRQPLFSLDILHRDGSTIDEIGFDQAELKSFTVDKAQREIVMQFALKELPIRITCRIKSTEGEFTFSGEIDNQSAQTILGFTYPMVQAVQPPASDLKNLTLVHPDMCGQIERNALASSGVDTSYPGRAVMGWLDLSSERGGLSLASHDKTRTGTRLTALPALENTFDLSLGKEIRIAPRSKWQAPEHVLIVHEGDWHVAANHYRNWARGWLIAAAMPQWLRESDGWVLTSINNGLPYWQLPDIHMQAQWMGTEHLQVHGQGVDNEWFDAEGKRQYRDMTFPYPSPRYGTMDEMRQAIRDIHARNGRVTFYFLYERWTPSLETAQNLGSAQRSAVPQKYFPPNANFYADNALVDHPGAQPPQQHPPLTERMMCLGAPSWQEWMRFWAIDVYAKELGADGIYWDVMGRNGPFRCFNGRHNHHGENQWARGSANVLERIHNEARPLNPGFINPIEGAQDALLPWAGLHLISGATKTPEVLRYTFPEMPLIDGFSNHAALDNWKWTQLEKARRVFLNGERFDLHGYHAEVRRYVWLRKRLKPFIDWPARFVDTIGLSISDTSVQAKRFVRDDGANRAVLVTMMNENAKDKVLVTTQLNPLRQIKTAHIFTPDGEIRPLQILAQRNGIVSFYAPTDVVSGALFVESVEPALQVIPTLEQISTPGEDGVELTLFYPAGKGTTPITNLSSAANIPLQEIAGRKAKSPQVEHSSWKPVGGLQNWPGWEKVHAKVRWGDNEATAWSLLYRPLLNGDFEQLRPGGQLAHWPTLPSTEDPAKGKYCLKLEDPTGNVVLPDGRVVGLIHLVTPLKPATHYRFSAKIKRDADKTDARAAVVEYEEGQKLRVSASIGSGGKANEWQEFSTEFTSHPNPRSSAVYLYLGQSKVAWFDDLKLEQVR